MQVSLRIALRYFLSKKGNNAVHFVSLASVIGVAIGTMALILVLSVFSGLENYFLNTSKEAYPDLLISPILGKRLDFSDTLSSSLDKFCKNCQIQKGIKEKVFVSRENKSYIANLKAYPSDYFLQNKFKKNISFGGNIPKNKTNGLLIGFDISQQLNLDYDFLNTRVDVAVPKPGKGQINSLESAFHVERAIVFGVFSIYTEEDKSLIYCNVRFAQKLLSFEQNQYSFIEIRSKDQNEIDDLYSLVKLNFKKNLIIQNRKEQMSHFYKLLNMENTVAYLIFFLILFVSTFSVAASIIMLILHKKNDLKTLTSLGMTFHEVKNIFVYKGLLVTIMGGVCGILVGMVLVLIQKYFEIFKIRTTGLPIPYPVSLNESILGITLLTVLFLGLFCSWISSKSIDRNILFLS